MTAPDRRETLERETLEMLTEDERQSRTAAAMHHGSENAYGEWIADAERYAFAAHCVKENATLRERAAIVDAMERTKGLRAPYASVEFVNADEKRVWRVVITPEESRRKRKEGWGETITSAYRQATGGTGDA